MKILTFIILMLGIGSLVGCVPDGDPEIGPAPSDESCVPVELHLGVASDEANVSRATNADYSDTLKSTGDWMRNWFVVIAHGNEIDSIITNQAYHAGEHERPADICWARLKPGTYTFYSFANIQPSEIGLAGKTKGDALPADFEQATYHVKIPKLAFADHWSDFGDDDNPFFAKGIPMSNKQEVTITSDTKQVDLEVIRMVAKLQLNITNSTDHDVTIQSVALTDITPSDGQADNLKLFPATDETDANGIAHVGHPNLATSAKEVATYKPLLDKEGYVVSAHGGKQYLRLYVNESEATAENKYLVLQLQTASKDGVATDRRYAMLDWKQICRNDFRAIPINLEDYAIHWVVEAFSPTGVLPDVEEHADSLTINFGYYGEFHINPSVRKLSTGTDISGTASSSWDYWSFADWTPIALTPSGDAGTNIFDRNPRWVKASNNIEGEMGNRTGTAVYKLSLKVWKNLSNQEVTLTRKVRFTMNAVNNLSKSRVSNIIRHRIEYDED